MRVVLTFTLLVPLTDWLAVLLPYEPLVVPYSNHTVLATPFALTVPFKVAELAVIAVAEPVVTVGVVPLVFVMVIVSVPILPALSLAVTVITLLPLERLIPEAFQLVVPIAVPLPPLSFAQLTLFIPLVVSEALPPKLIVELVEVYVESDVGLVMVIVGAVVSKII